MAGITKMQCSVPGMALIVAGEYGRQLPPPLNFCLSEKKFVRKFYSKNTKFGANDPHFGGISGKIEI